MGYLPEDMRGLGCDICGDMFKGTQSSETVALATDTPVKGWPAVLVVHKRCCVDGVFNTYPLSYGGAWFRWRNQIESLRKLHHDFGASMDNHDALAVMNYVSWLGAKADKQGARA